jgi:hypothetical protein
MLKGFVYDRLIVYVFTIANKSCKFIENIVIRCHISEEKPNC